VKRPRLRRRAPAPAPVDRQLWPHDYVGPNPRIQGACRIKQRWAGGAYIIRSRSDQKLYTVPREHVQHIGAAEEASHA
jgi:hypothetical protein